MKCDQVKEFLDLFYAGDCKSQLQQQIQGHLSTCQMCARESETSGEIAKNLDRDLKEIFKNDPAIALKEKKLITVMEDRIIETLARQYSEKKNYWKKVVLPFSFAVAVFLFFITLVITSADSIGHVGDRKINRGDLVRTDSEPKLAVMPGTEVSIRPNSELKFVSAEEIELNAGSIEVSIFNHADFIVRTRMGKVRAKGTKFQVRLTLSMLVFVFSGAVQVSTDNEERLFQGGEAAIVYEDGIVRKLDNIQELQEKHREIFDKIKSENKFERAIALDEVVEHSTITKDEKKQILVWALDTLDLDSSSILTAINGFSHIKVFDTDVENILSKYFKHSSRNVVLASVATACNNGLTRLKEDLIDVFKKEVEKSFEDSNVDPEMIFTCISKLGFTKKDFQAVIDADARRLYRYIKAMDTTKNESFKEVFGKMLDDSAPAIIVAGVFGVRKFKAKEYIKRLIELAESAKSAFKYIEKSEKETLGKLAVETIAEIGTVDNAKDIVTLLDHSDSSIRALAIRTIMSWGGKGNEEQFAKLLEDKSDEVCSEAISALTKLKAKQYVDEIFKLLNRRPLPNGVIQTAIKELLLVDKSKDDLIELFKSIDWKDNYAYKCAILQVLVSKKITDVLPELIKDLSSCVDRVHVDLVEYIQVNLLSAIATLGTKAAHGEDMFNIFKKTSRFGLKLRTLKMLREWKAKEYAEDIAKLLDEKDSKYYPIEIQSLKLEAVRFLLENDCLNGDLEEKAIKVWKEYISNKSPQFSPSLDYFKNLDQKKKASSPFIDVLLDRCEERYSWAFDINRSLKTMFSDEQQGRLQKIVLTNLHKLIHWGPVKLYVEEFLDYKKHKKEIITSIIKFLEGDNAKRHEHNLKFYLSGLDPENKGLLGEKIVVNNIIKEKNSYYPDRDNYYATVGTLINALKKSGFKVEFKVTNKTEFPSIVTIYGGPDYTVSNVLSSLHIGKHYAILQPDRTVFIFDDVKEVKEYLKKQLEE